MFNAITHLQVWVLDQDEALEFYVGKLGLAVAADMPMGHMRRLSVRVPGSASPRDRPPRPGPPAEAAFAESVRGLLAQRPVGMVILTTDDAHAAFEKIRAAGATVVQEPMQQFYGSDFAVADPYMEQG